MEERVCVHSEKSAGWALFSLATLPFLPSKPGLKGVSCGARALTATKEAPTQQQSPIVARFRDLEKNVKREAGFPPMWVDRNALLSAIGFCSAGWCGSVRSRGLG